MYGPHTNERLVGGAISGRREEVFLATKFGIRLEPGDPPRRSVDGSPGYVRSACEASLTRLGVEHIDLYYQHRVDPNTPIEETVGALEQAVRSGKALYAGISNYDVAQTQAALQALRALRVPCLLHQMPYSMFRRTAEEGLFATLVENGVGAIAFSPLAQGLLTDRYLSGIPADSRAGKPGRSLSAADLTSARREQMRALAAIAAGRGQSLAQLALAWVLRHPGMTSALVGASHVDQLEDSLAALNNLGFEAAELAQIDRILSVEGCCT